VHACGLVVVIGCADPPIASDGHAWKRRMLDTMTIGCTGSDVTWKLTCVGNQWHGTYSNCTAGTSTCHCFVVSTIDTRNTQTVPDSSAETEKIPVILTHDNYLIY